LLSSLPLIDEIFMTLSQAVESLKRSAADMDARYGKIVFDEWALVCLQKGHERLVSYLGSRKEHFQKNFVNDLSSLRGELLTAKHQPGHFDFSRHAVGTSFDAFVCAGEELYVICNNTQSSMDQITSDPRWLDAQKAFATMTEQFQADPLAL
jgi:hypothetical protein